MNYCTVYSMYWQSIYFILLLSCIICGFPSMPQGLLSTSGPGTFNYEQCTLCTNKSTQLHCSWLTEELKKYYYFLSQLSLCCISRNQTLGHRINIYTTIPCTAICIDQPVTNSCTLSCSSNYDKLMGRGVSSSRKLHSLILKSLGCRSSVYCLKCCLS